MTSDIVLRFDGIARPVVLNSCPEVVDALARVCPGWRFAETAHVVPAGAALTLKGHRSGYDVSAPWLGHALRRDDLASAVCALIAELFRAETIDDPTLLCVHGGAVEMSERLIVFPSLYRAGKSLLCAALAARGARLFTDDVLPVRAPDDLGFAAGVQPRLRMPLPEDLKSETRAFIDARAGLEGSRYRYLDLTRDRLADRGTAAPLGAVVLLDRQDGAPATFAAVGKGEALRTVIWQNFARRAPGAEVMRRLYRAVDLAPCLRLRYGRADDAAEAIVARFGAGDWTAPACDTDTPRHTGGPVRSDATTSPATTDSEAGRLYVRDGTVAELGVDGDRFLARGDGRAIHHLNAMGAAIWRLLAEPVGAAPIVDILAAAFPDAPRARIDADVRKLLDDLEAKDLIETAEEDHARVPG